MEYNETRPITDGADSRRSSPATGSDPEADDCAYDEDYDGQFCHFCGGDGYVFGDDLGDPLWYDSHEIYRCTCCHGSGKAKDCTWW